MPAEPGEPTEPEGPDEPEEPTPTPPEPTPTPPEPTPTPPTENLIWSSNIHGKWNDGKKRTLTTKQGGQTADDKSIFVAASGSPELIIDGDGTAHLHAGSGGCDNISLKLRSRHNEGGAESNRVGGEGFACDSSNWDSKRENFHNDHDSLGGKGLPSKLMPLKWAKLKGSVKDESANKIRLKGAVDYKDGKGYQEVMNLVDTGAPASFFDKTLFKKMSYFWIRLNNSAHGRIYVVADNYDSQLELEFMFEPAKSSIALRNVELTKI